jgi:predicted nucleotidyltransferase
MALCSPREVGPADVLRRTTEVASFCRRFGVSRLDLFGSTVAGAARPDSDLDFLVDFKNQETSGFADAYFGLLEALEALFGRPVDFVGGVGDQTWSGYRGTALRRLRATVQSRRDDVHGVRLTSGYRF